MLGLVEGMYGNWKEKIGDANKAEKKQKAEFEKTIADLDSKMKTSACGQDTYRMIEKYWKKQRAISHKQYHNVLKIAHAGMEKFKGVIAAMKGAMAGKKLDAKTAK